MSIIADKNLADLQPLMKALNAQGYNQAPSNLTQTGALQMEDLSSQLYNVTVREPMLNLQKMLGSPQKCKSLTYQFNRQISIGQIGYSAVLEGQIGEETTSNYLRVIVPMAYYSHTRNITLQATLLATFDGQSLEERQAKDAAFKMAQDCEMDLFRGRELFSNAGLFDGNPAAMPLKIANMVGLDVQIRQSNSIDANAVDLGFVEWGQNESIVIPVNSSLSQDVIENATLALILQFGELSKAQGIIEPTALSAYNKLSFGINRFILSNAAAITKTGTQLNSQYTSAGEISFEVSQFLRGKVTLQSNQLTSVNAPSTPTLAASAQAAGSTTFVAGQVYNYFITAANERGESRATAARTTTIATNGNSVTMVCTPAGSGAATRWFNIYRTNAGAAAPTAKFIGRVASNGSAVTFTDLNNRSPAASTGYILSKDTMEVRELLPYTRMKMAQVQAAQTESHLRFLGLAVYIPKQNVILDNISRSI